MNERMKRRKGFTLIELLAVIVILAIIALIAIPSIIKILNKTRLSAAIDSAYGILSAAETYVANQILLNKDSNISDLTFEAYDGKVCVSQNDCLSFKGTKPSSGYVYILNNGSNFVLENLVINGFTCNKPIFEDKVTCEKTKSTEIIDENEGIICGDGNTEDYDNLTECYIKSIADYKEFTDLVNSGKNFSGKTVYLTKNLDLNGVSLETIGNDNNKFEGTFEGNGNTLKNIKIDLGTDYVGIFGYNTGTIRGFNVENIIVKGNNYVGGIAGYNNGRIEAISITGNISGNSEVGGIAGRNGSVNTKGIINVLVKNIDVTSNEKSSGGIAGMAYMGRVLGIVEKGSIKGQVGAGCISGSQNYSGDYNGYCSGEVEINEVLNSNGYKLGSDMLTYYNKYLDTIYGGDNDSDGYYFDYDNKGILVVKSIKDYPIEFNLKGSGTVEDPYQIGSVSDFNNAAINLTETSSSKIYSLINDIDFSGKKVYSFGLETIPFTGTFEGNGNTLKNIKIDLGTDYVGIFGYNTGTIRGFNVENIIVKGNNYVGGIAGYNNGRIEAISITGNISGNSEVGGIAGRNGSVNTKGIINVLVKNIDVTSNEKSSGGIAGMAYMGRVLGIVEKGSIKGPIGVGCISGSQNYSGDYNGYCSSDTTINGVNVTGNNVIDLTKVTDFNATYKTYLDTESDSDSDGYYFIYDSNKKSMILKKA